MNEFMSSSLELAKACANAAHNIQAEDIRIIDLRGLSTITDFLVICSGTSMPHLKAVMRDVHKEIATIKEESPHYSEGKADSRWVILDYIDVMVHIMHEEMRELYNLEGLWGDGKLIEWLDEGAENSPA